MERKDLIRDVLKAAADFNDRRLWTRFTNFDCFAVKVPDRNESMLGVVMGDAGEQFGLSLLRGETATASLASLTGSDGPGDDETEAMDMLAFSMDTFGELSTEAQARVREAGLHPRYTDPVPNCMAKHPGQQPRVPDESELALLLMVMRGAIDADQRKLLEPARLDNPEGVWTLVLSGDPAAPQVSVTRQRRQPAVAPQVIPFPAATPDLAGLPRLDATWLVGLPVLPGRIQGDDRSLLMLLVVDDASQYVFQARLVFAGELGDAIDMLLETFRGGAGGRKGLPRKIVFSSKNLHDAIAPALRQAGVTCLYMPVVPKLAEIAADLAEHLDALGPSLSEPPEAAAAQAVPAPDDLAGWKEADRRVGTRFADYLKFEDRLWSSRAAKRYFGRDDLDYFFKTEESRGVVAAYVAWGILDYRPTKKSRTRAEEMLAEGLPQPEAILLRARIEAHPTLYRVAGHDPKAGTVDLEDVLLGGAVTVRDQLMSENINNGEFFGGRAFAAGRFHFIELAGPPLGEGMGMEAVEFLQDCEMEFTPDGLRRDAHMLGWLWDWADEWEANWKPPHLCNTDGEDFLWHTASFHVADPAAVRQALLQRKDIEHDEQANQYVWNRATERDAKMLGGPVTLGRIEFVGDELVLTANSAKRFANGRLWLEKLPGVDFLSVTTRRWDEADEDRPMDERIAKPKPVEMTPELTAAVQEFTDRQYMQWLDTPLPILGGKTPRQACATPTGRKQVTMLIRTTPDPMGEGSVRVPRQTMLQALGLGAAPPAPPAPPLRMPPGPEGPGIVLPRKKVGRNDPCPCGSGKKFKKCCGP